MSTAVSSPKKDRAYISPFMYFLRQFIHGSISVGCIAWGDKMVPEVAREWVLIAALSASILSGIAVLFVSLRTGWIARKIALLTLGYGFLGAILLSIPKANEIIVDIRGFKATIAKLEQQSDRLMAQNQALETQVDQFNDDKKLLAKLSSDSSESAAQWVDQAERARSLVEWANFLPANRSSVKVAIGSYNAQDAQDLADKLDISVDDLVNLINSSGYTLLKKAEPTQLQVSPATDVWLPAVGGK